jgi:hypothetical protein
MNKATAKPETNPLVKTDAFTEELFQKIKDENISVDPAVWALLSHVLGNRVYVISLILGDYLSIPKWIVNAGSSLMKFLYWISGHKDKLHNIDLVLEKGLTNCYQIRDFLGRLRQATQRKGGF